MRRLVKQVIVGLLIVFAAAQLPFVFRRWKMSRLSAQIAELDASRVSRANSTFSEYKGIIHAHTSLGGHTEAGFDELIDASNANNLDFVLMTEHYSDTIDTSALTLNGIYGRTLFIGGNEIDTADGDRLLMVPGSAEAAGLKNLPTAQAAAKLRLENRLALVTAPEKFRSWDAAIDGTEIFSTHAAARSLNPLVAAGDLVWSYNSFSELVLMSGFSRPAENLQKFDEISANRKAVLFAGADAHSNIGASLFADATGKSLLSVKLDPYKTIFALARNHVLIKKGVPLTRESLITAIRNGSFYVGLDRLADSSGFSFAISPAGAPDTSYTMGDEVSGALPARIEISSPQPARFVIFLNGQPVSETRGSAAARVDVDQPGTYRVEAYLDQLGPPFDTTPWIISNPIYLR